jgi:hypothetical protein
LRVREGEGKEEKRGTFISLFSSDLLDEFGMSA